MAYQYINKYELATSFINEKFNFSAARSHREQMVVLEEMQGSSEVDILNKLTMNKVSPIMTA